MEAVFPDFLPVAGTYGFHAAPDHQLKRIFLKFSVAYNRKDETIGKIG
ncbi:MAG: hypothetical protein P8184_12585 [Calditrichia bacterium]